MPGYYDSLLAAIPLTLLVGVAASTHSAVGLHQGLAAGSLAATVLLYEALFRNPPVEMTRRDAAACSAVIGGWLGSLWLFL